MDFYVIKGIVSLVATVGLVFHMLKTWPTVEALAQRLRYVTLLYFAAFLTLASAKQVHGKREDVSLVNWLALIGALLLMWTVYVSIRDEIIRRRTHRR